MDEEELRSLAEILNKPVNPVEYELLKRGDMMTSIEVTEQTVNEIRETLLKILPEPMRIYRQESEAIKLQKAHYNIALKKAKENIVDWCGI